MSKFTKESPFEFDGTKVWREDGDVRTHYEPREYPEFVAQADARAAHALIEAENNDWREDGKGFRKGRWFVDASEQFHVYVSHEDITSEAWGCFDLTDWDSGTPDTVREIGASFHDWHGATHPKQPAEPMGFGAVVKSRELMLIRAQIADRDYPWLSVEGVRYQWAEILERGPITGLSGGWVTS